MCSLHRLSISSRLPGSKAVLESERCRSREPYWGVAAGFALGGPLGAACAASPTCQADPKAVSIALPDSEQALIKAVGGSHG